MNTICLDSIIFGLQRNGGISNYWARLLDSFSAAPDPAWRTEMPRKIRFQHFRPHWQLGASHSETLPSGLSRYLSCALAPTDAVMHTSYYRLPSKRVKGYVVTAYDFMYERYRSGPPLWVHRLQKLRSLERADVVSCISTFTRDEVIDIHPGIDASKLKVVPLGVDSQAFYPDPQESDSELDRTVLFIGLRGGYKRFELAVAAIESIADLKLGIVGPPLDAAEERGLSINLPGRWQHFGAVAPGRLRELYSSAFALIFPSDCEGFGLPVLEAMACHCPVVASCRGSLPEVGGDAARFAAQQRAEDYAAALLDLNSSSVRAKAIAAGTVQVAAFTWQRTIQSTREIYSALLD